MLPKFLVRGLALCIVPSLLSGTLPFSRNERKKDAIGCPLVQARFQHQAIVGPLGRAPSLLERTGIDEARREEAARLSLTLPNTPSPGFAGAGFGGAALLITGIGLAAHFLPSELVQSPTLVLGFAFLPKRLVHTRVRATETDLESLVTRASLELLQLITMWEGIPKGKRIESDRPSLESVRRTLSALPWPADRPVQKGRSQEIAGEVKKLSPLFRAAWSREDDPALAILNQRAQDLLVERLAIQLKRTEEFISRNNISAAMMTIRGGAETLELLLDELYWQRVRDAKKVWARVFQTTDWLGAITETLGLEGWGVLVRALGVVTIPQRYYVKRMIQGIETLRPEIRAVVHASLRKAFRSQVKILDSQQRDFSRVIDQGAQLRHIERLLRKRSATIRKNALVHLRKVLAWARRGRVDAKRRATIKLKAAVQALEANDIELTVQHTTAARGLLRTIRLPNIKEIRALVAKRAVALLNQIRFEQEWTDELRALRDTLPEKASRKDYLQWLNSLRTRLSKTPFQKKAPAGVEDALARLQPTMDMLERMGQLRQDPTVNREKIAGLQQSVKDNVQEIRNDLSLFLGQKPAPTSERVPAAVVALREAA